MSQLVIEQRFCGPPDCGNGGYTAGLLASLLPGPVEVTLRAPAPLDIALRHELRDGRALLTTEEGTLIAEAVPLEFELATPAPVSFEGARHATEAFIGFHEHPYPGCFVCGTRRLPQHGPGLSLFPGAVAQRHGGPEVVASPFVPGPEWCDAESAVRPELVWAALDCPSWFGHAAFANHNKPILLGRLAVSIARRPSVQEHCVVLGWSLGQEGRRIQCGSALFGADGGCLAYARSTWIELKVS
jgi:hypothetical protein